MSTFTLNLVEILFNHKPVEVHFLSKKTSQIVTISPQFLSSRHNFASPGVKISGIGVKISGIAKMFDYLYQKGEPCRMCIYFSAKNKIAYVELADSSGTIHSLITPNEVRVYEAAESISQKWHLLPLIAVQWMMNADCSLISFLEKVQSNISAVQNAIGFTDEFYYYGKDKGLLSSVPIDFGNATILAEAKRAFQNGMFSEKAMKFGEMISAFEQYQTKKEKNSSNQQIDYEKQWEEIKAGKYLLNYQWRDDLQDYIKPLSFLDKYVPDRLFWQLFHIFKIRTQKALNRIKEAENAGLPVPEAQKDDCLNIFLHGRAGTGKSYLLYALSAAFGIPAPFTNCSKGTEEDTYEGITKVIDGELTEIETSMIKVSQDGGMWIGEEFDLTDPEVNKGVFNQLTEYPYIAMKSGYKPVKRHPLAIFAATFNVGEQSPRMDPALSSRFVPSLRFKDPTKEDFIKRMIASGAKEDTANQVYDAYIRILTMLKDPDINGEECEEYIVPRLCIETCNLIDKDNLDFRTAIEICIINKIAETRPDVADEIYVAMDSYF